MSIMPQDPDRKTSLPPITPACRGGSHAFCLRPTCMCHCHQPSEDPEEFCSDCFAGMESSEHHEKCVAPLDDEDEVDCGHHSWAGLMSLLDEHWPEDIFPTREDDIARDAGARIVSLMRWVDRLSADARRVEALAAQLDREGVVMLFHGPHNRNQFITARIRAALSGDAR